MTQEFPGGIGDAVGGAMDTARGTVQAGVNAAGSAVSASPPPAAASPKKGKKKKDAVLGTGDDAGATTYTAQPTGV